MGSSGVGASVVVSQSRDLVIPGDGWLETVGSGIEEIIRIVGIGHFYDRPNVRRNRSGYRGRRRKRGFLISPVSEPRSVGNEGFSNGGTASGNFHASGNLKVPSGNGKDFGILLDGLVRITHEGVPRVFGEGVSRIDVRQGRITREGVGESGEDDHRDESEALTDSGKEFFHGKRGYLALS